MNKKLLFFGFFIFLLGINQNLIAQNESAIDQSNIILDFGSGNQYYNLFGSGNPNFNGANFGDFTCGDTFLLDGAQHSTHKCGDHNITYNELNYRVYLTTDTPPAFNNIQIFYNQDNGTNLYCSNSSNDQNWQTDAANIDILSGLPIGTYYIEVYTIANYESFSDGNGTHFITNFGANFIATFSVDDNILPTLTCPGDITVSNDAGDCSAVVTYNVPFADNCPGSAINQTSGLASGAAFPIGTTTNTFVVTDAAGNTATCSFNVTVNDTSPPNAICQNITVNLDPDGTINISELDIDNGSSDNCGIQSISISPSSFNCSNIGNNNVILTVTDINGNSSSCTSIVTIQDITPPDANCGSTTIILDAITGEATISDLNSLYTGSGDSCSSVTLSLSQTTFGCNDIGDNNVILTITDSSGNTNTCTVTVTVEAPTITSGTLTGIVVDPLPDTIVPASELIEVTACPGGVAVPKDVQLTLNLDGNSTINASNVSIWQISTDDGLTWTDVSGTNGLTQYTLLDLLTTTLVRIVIQSGDCYTISPLAIIRFLPPDEPPVIVSVSDTNICLTESVTIEAESYYEYASQFGEGGFFNYAQPEDWRVDGIDGFFPASGNNANEPTWKETNGPKILSGIRYDVVDNTKFAAANGPVYTTLETPVFNTIGMNASEATLEFYQAYYFCNGGQGSIELSFDGGNTYTTTLTTDQGDNYTSPNNSGFTVQRISSCNNNNNGQHPTTTGLQFTSIDLSAYLGMANLRIRFTFDALGTSQCSNSYFPPDPGNTCNNIPTNFNVYSSWVIDNVGFPYAPIDEVLEWTDENGGVIATGSTVNVTPVTPGVQDFGVTSLVNGCRADGDAGTEFVTINTSLAYAGKDFLPISGDCGQSSIALTAYDNTLTAVQNYNLGSWDNNYVVPNISNGDTDYPGTGVTGSWSIISSTTSGCGNSATFSSLSNPRAVFTGDPGSYTLRWTLQNGCYDDVNITINSCSQVDFDGIDDFVNFKNNYQLGNTFSIEAWIKPNNTTGNKTVLSKRNSTTNNSGYDLTLENGVLKFNWFSNSGNGSISSNYLIGTNRWYHVAVTFNGSNYLLYIDGISVGNTSGTVIKPDITAGNVECLIGALDSDYSSNNNVTNFFNGWIDEIRIWNKAISELQLRQMMNQQIYNNGAVRGEIVPLDVPGLNWSDLDGYYRMDVACGNLTAYKGANGRLRNINSSQQETAPLPYTSRVDNQDWETDNTWTHFNVWDAPNSIGVDGSTYIDWNIVQASHNINSGDKNITVLGLISNVINKELTITDPFTTQNETNNGQSLRITHYLKLDGNIDLVGESQLLQDEGSILDVSSLGKIERDQQGTTNLYNYNYWSSPVTLQGSLTNNGNYNVAEVLNDGTNSNTPLSLNNPAFWTSSHNANPNTTPITLSRRWLYAYENYTQDTYAAWRALDESDDIATGLSFTMKGSGVGGIPFNGVQNYVFIGKPNNGTISTPITIGNQALVGNPYPSAIDANEFILDNIPGGNSGTSQSIDGTLYYWEHYISNFTHVLEEYEGGYAAYNLSGGVAAVSPPLVSGNGTPTKLPGRYIPVSQGFFVTASNIGGNVTFNNDQRTFVRETPANSTFIRSNNSNLYAIENSNSTSEDLIQRVRLEFTTPEGAIRPILLAFTPDNSASDGVDYGYDAPNTEDLPNDMSWLINNEPYIIQGVGAFDETKQFPLGVYLSDNGNIQIALTNTENFEASINVYLYDNLLNTYTLLNDINYSMYLESNDYLNRYFITFIEDDTLSAIDEEFKSLIINYLTSSNEIYVNAPNNVIINKIKLLNILGQTIQTWDINKMNLSNEFKIPVENVSEGNYIISLETQNNKLNKKIIIKN